MQRSQNSETLQRSQYSELRTQNSELKLVPRYRVSGGHSGGAMAYAASRVLACQIEAARSLNRRSACFRFLLMRSR